VNNPSTAVSDEDVVVTNRSAGETHAGHDLGTPLPDTYMPDMVVAVEEKRVQSRRRVLKLGKIVCCGRLHPLYEPSGMVLRDVRVVRRVGRLIGVAIATRNIAESVDLRFRQLRLMR
jgi:hypothetical protein